MHAQAFLKEAADICAKLDADAIDRMAARLSVLQGKLYIIGFGGSLANAIHMAADLRKLCDIDAIAPNIAEMTANMNDGGMDNAFSTTGAKLTDALFVLSVGGGTDKVSPAIIRQIDRAKKASVPIFGIVGPNGGYTAEHADICIRVPVDNLKHITPHTEAFQAVIWHALVSHPLLQKRATKW